MFSKATAKFVRQIDPEGSLIPVSRVNDSHKLDLMALVVKRNRMWFWQTPKYQPTYFTLSDLLQGDKVLTPGTSEKEFLTYKGTFGDKLSGKLDTEAGSLSLSLEGQGTSMLQSFFGKLKKEELDVKKLLHDSSNRLLNMQHRLVQQLKKRDDVLVVVKERILTTSSCTVNFTKKEKCTLQGVFGLASWLGSPMKDTLWKVPDGTCLDNWLGNRFSLKLCVKDTNDIEANSDVSLEIPSDTVIAYSILELEIKKDGHYDICLQPDGTGGIEADSHELSWPSHDSLHTVDGKCNGSREMDLSPLAELPESTRCALFNGLQETLKDRTALSYLQCALEDLCCGETPDVADYDELSESQRKLVSAILDRLGVDNPTEDSQCGDLPQLNAAHLLVSAMGELPDETLSLLSRSCPYFLKAFDNLMGMLKGRHELLSSQCPPLLLQDDEAFQLAEQLLSSTNMTLKRDADRLWTETGSKTGDLRLVLCLSTHGLTVLCKGLE